MNGDPDFNPWEADLQEPVPAKTRKRTPKAPVVRTPLPDRMPEDIEAEASLLATCCSIGNGPKEVEVCLTLTPEDFASPINKAIFTALRVVQKSGEEVNSITLHSQLEKLGLSAKVGGFVGLTEILMREDVPNPMALAQIVLEKSRLRKLIHLGARIIEQASGVGECGEIISEASEGITALAIANPSKQIITDLSDLLDDLADGKQITTENGGRAMSWGDSTLDSICPIPRGEPTLVVARPGCGKSAFAIQIVTATIEKDLGKPLFLSLEMGREKIKARFAAHLSDVNSRAFRDGQYDGAAIERIIDRKRVLSGMRVMFPNQQCQVEDIETLVHHAVDIHGCTCVVLDQFSHIHAPRDAKKEIFAIANAMLSQRLTALAKNLNLGWVTLGQINRDGEDSRRPNMKDLADTDRLAKDAAVIFGLWNKGSDDNQEVWGTVIKNRDDGHKGWARQLSTDYGTCSFRVMEQETFAPQPKRRF